MTRIRRAERDDSTELARLAEETFRETFAAENSHEDMDLHCSRQFGPDIQLSEITDPDFICLLGEESGEVAGYAQARLNSEIDIIPASRPFELFRLYVTDKWKGRGTAQRLMDEMLYAAAVRASDWVWLGVWERNSRAIAFYRKFGFRIIGEHAFQLGNDIQRDLIMVLNDSTEIQARGLRNRSKLDD